MPASLLPPRKKDVVPGRRQIGLFIRFVHGARIEASVNRPTEAVDLAADWLLHMTACKHGCALCHDIRHTIAINIGDLNRRIREKNEATKTAPVPARRKLASVPRDPKETEE